MQPITWFGNKKADATEHQGVQSRRLTR